MGNSNKRQAKDKSNADGDKSEIINEEKEHANNSNNINPNSDNTEKIKAFSTEPSTDVNDINGILRIEEGSHDLDSAVVPQLEYGAVNLVMFDEDYNNNNVHIPNQNIYHENYFDADQPKLTGDVRDGDNKETENTIDYDSNHDVEVNINIEDKISSALEATQHKLQQTQDSLEPDESSATNLNTTSVWAVELMFLLFKIAESILEPTVRLYLYESVCLNLYPNHENHYVCDHLKSDRLIEHEVQNKAARYMLYYKILINFPAMVVVLCCGVWSDSSGRTTPIILTCLGTVLAVLAYMISSINIFHGIPSLPIILLGAGIRGVFGRSAIMTMAVNSYVSDNSHLGIRTQRLSNLAAMSHFGYLLGSSSAGFLLDRCGFSTVFLIVIVIDAICVLVAYGCMRDRTSSEVSIFSNMLHESPEEEKPLIPGTPRKPRSKSHRCQTISTSEDLIIIQVPTNDGETPTAAQKTITNSKKIDFEKNDKFSSSLPAYSIDSYMDNGVKITDVTKTSCQSVDLSHWKSYDTVVESLEDSNDAFRDSTSNIPSKLADDVPQGDYKTPSKLVEAEDMTPPKKSTSIARSLFGSFRVLSRQRSGRLRCNIWALFIIIYLHQMNKSGDTDIYLLFTKRTPLSVSRSLYGYLLSANYACLGLFAFFIPKIFNCIDFHAKDSTLAMTGVVFRIVSLIILFFSKSVWMLVLAAVLSGPHSLTVSTVKSMVSKIVESGEMGKTFSLMSSGETLSNLLGTLIFTSIYSVTSHIHPGICFVFEAAVYCIIFFIIVELASNARGSSMFSFCCHSRSKTYDDDDDEKSHLLSKDPNVDPNSKLNQETKTPLQKILVVEGSTFDRTPQDSHSQAIYTTPHN